MIYPNCKDLYWCSYFCYFVHIYIQECFVCNVYLRFTSADAHFGRHTGHVFMSNIISGDSASASATSKYDSAVENNKLYKYVCSNAFLEINR